MVSDCERRRRGPRGRNQCHRNAVTLSLFSGIVVAVAVAFIGRGPTVRLCGDLSSTLCRCHCRADTEHVGLRRPRGTCQ